MKRLKSFLFRLFLLAFSGLLALVGMEFFLRWREARATRALLADASKAGTIASDIPGLHYTLRPGATNEHYAFNSLGFNMPERSASKPDRVHRIVVVGDSVTQGVGAERLEDAYPNRLDALLRERGYAGIEVWNCGTGGYNVDQVFLMLSHIVTNYAPDAVIYGFCFNDYWGPNFFLNGQAAQPAGAGDAGAGRVGFLDRIKQLRTVGQAKRLYDRVHYRARGYLPVFVDRKIDYPSWTAMKHRIAEMDAFCRARGWPFAVSIVPMPQFIHVEDSRNLALHDLRAFLAKEGIRFADATPVLRDHHAEELFAVEDNHPNSRGYQLIAEHLAGWLQTNRAAFLEGTGK